ncbi:MAG: mechanosensitive ion channel family protein [Phycisphaerae bacterium]
MSWTPDMLQNIYVTYGIRFGVPAVGLAAGWLVHAVVFALASRLARRTPYDLDNILVARLRGPTRLMAMLAGAMVGLPMARLSPWHLWIVGQVTNTALIIGVFWTLSRCVSAFRDLLLSRYEGRSETLRARQVRTQVTLLSRVVKVLLVVLAVGGALMTFPQVRQVGVGLLASAGVVGIVLGVATQRTLGNVMAGVMIAFTQPIRLNDVVFVEGEWGRVEEMTLTYVVIRVWDLRRLVVPITYFIETPFQNWTRISPDLLGYALLYLDHNAPIDRINEQLRTICAESDNWDGDVAEVQIIDSTETTVLAWALVSAGGAWEAWNLRCEVREKLIAWMRRELPEALPRKRLVGVPLDGGVDPPIAHTRAEPGPRRNP